MWKWKDLGARIAAIPVPAILFVLALGLFTWGAYTASPWNVPGVPLEKAFDNQGIYEVGLGIIYMIIGGLRIVGAFLKNKKMMLAAPFALMMGYLFLAILRITVVGWFPVTWLPLIVCSFISGICRLALLYGPNRE